MLVIKNIETIEQHYIGKWQIVEVVENQNKVPNFNNENYCIRLTRNGDVGAAIIIERQEGQYGYNVAVCYEEYDNVISITPWPKDRLNGRANFLASMRGIIDAEYDKRNT